MANAREEKRTTVLVTAGSKHGSTTDIARRIARVLEAGGLAVVESAPADVADPARFDAIVLGSAVYAGHWTSDAIDLARRIGELSPAHTDLALLERTGRRPAQARGRPRRRVRSERDHQRP